MLGKLFRIGQQISADLYITCPSGGSIVNIDNTLTFTIFVIRYSVHYADILFSHYSVIYILTYIPDKAKPHIIYMLY